MSAVPSPDRQLFARHARKGGRVVAVLRAIETGAGCVVESEVYPAGASQPTRSGPYRFADAAQATAFVTEAVEALIYLGCEVQAA